MTMDPLSSPAKPVPQAPRHEAFLAKLPLTKWMLGMKISRKLILGFGSLVALTLLVIGLSFLARTRATQRIDSIADVRVPTALAAARAQASLLRMQSDVRGYLALGDQDYRTAYHQDVQTFEEDLDQLSRLASKLRPEDQAQLAELKQTYASWSEWPDKLFDLRDDQLEREPAYRLLATDGSRLGGTVLIDVNNMIQSQANREAASTDDIRVLGEMAQFQGTFAAMFSALRGYVTTRNPIYKQEYEVNQSANRFAWNTLLSRRGLLTTNQQAQLDDIAKGREQFLGLAAEVIVQLEGDHWREDLYLFRAQALPLADHMIKLLDNLTAIQQAQLQNDVTQGRQDLASADRQTLAGGVVALFLGISLALVFGQTIAGPIRRLTGVAEQIRAGDLEAQAVVESGDETGTLAETFNNMTGQLRRTLAQVTQEKKRADDLLHVVIPIGVDLSAEKDFDRLLQQILVEAKTFCRADSGILFLRTARDELEHVIVRNDKLAISMGGTTGHTVSFPAVPLYDAATHAAQDRNPVARAALTGESVNIRDTAEMADLDFSGIAGQAGDDYRVISFLAIPLKNSAGQVLGVLQLANVRDPATERVIPFDANLQQMMESYSSLAVAALEAYIREQGLRQEIQQLRIEIDEVKRQKQVSEIVDSDFFQNLQARARTMRNRTPRGKPDEPAGEGSEQPAKADQT